MAIVAHVGGLPIQESLIYLLPPLAIVVWIYALGRREKRNPRPPDETDEPDDDDV